MGVGLRGLLGCGAPPEAEQQAEPPTPASSEPVAEPPTQPPSEDAALASIVAHALHGHPNATLTSARWETPITHFGNDAQRLVHLVARDGEATLDAWLDEDTQPVWVLVHATDLVRRGPITAWHGRVMQLDGQWLWCPTSHDACALLPGAISIQASSTDSPDECWALVKVSASRDESWALDWTEARPTLQRVASHAARGEVGPPGRTQQLHGRAIALATQAIPRPVRALDVAMEDSPCAIDLTTLQQGATTVRAISCRIDEGGGYGVTIPALLYDVEVGDTHFQTPQHRALSGYEFNALIAITPSILIETTSSDQSSPSGASRCDVVALSASHMHAFARRASGTEGLGRSESSGGYEVALASRALHVVASPQGMSIDRCESYVGVHQRARDRWVGGRRDRQALDIAITLDAAHGFTASAEDMQRLREACSVSDYLRSTTR